MALLPKGGKCSGWGVLIDVGGLNVLLDNWDASSVVEAVCGGLHSGFERPLGDPSNLSDSNVGVLGGGWHTDIGEALADVEGAFSCPSCLRLG